MTLQLIATAVDTAALEAQVASAHDIAQAAHDVAVKAERDAATADAKAANARLMVLNRDPRLDTVEGRIAAITELADTLAQAIPASDVTHAAINKRIDDIALTPGPAGVAGVAGAQGLRGPSGVDGVQGLAGKDGAKGLDGAAGAAGVAGAAGAAGAAGTPGVSGTANLALGMAPVPLLALGANTTVVVSLSRTMPTTTYTTQVAHSAVLNLAGVRLEVVAKTATSVSVKVASVGVAVAAGTLVVIGT